VVWVKGFLQKSGGSLRGVLIATNQRVVFCRKGFFGNEHVESIDLGKLSGLDRKTSAWGREIAVHATHTTLQFRCERSARQAEDAFCTAIDEARAAAARVA